MEQTARHPRWSERGDTVFVSLDTGEVVRREAGLLPALYRWQMATGADSQAASSLFMSETGQLLRLDAATGSGA